MTKKRIILGVIGVIALSVITFALISYFSIDRTAEIGFENSFVIKGERYIATSIGYTEEGKIIAKADNFKIKEIPEDKDHNFLAVRSFLDNWIIVRESYVIPTEGDIGVVYLDHKRFTDGDEMEMVLSIVNEDFKDSFVVKTENMFEMSSATESIRVGYEDCPVGTDWIGVIGNINGFLVFVDREDMKDEDDLQYTCYVLKDEYQDLLKNGVKNTFETVED